MKEHKKCPWYIWAFSFLALFVLYIVSTVQIMGGIISRKYKLEQWFCFFGEFVLDFFIFFFLPVGLAAALLGNLAPELWNILGLPFAYLCGIYPAIHMWRWRSEHLSVDK